MPRINFEVEQIHKDGRFIDLVLHMGSRREAYGALIEAYIVAQKYWVPDQGRIPADVFQRERLAEALVETGWAVLEESGYYIRGSLEQFAWLVQRSDAGKQGGKKSGEARREKIEKKPKRNEAKRSGTKRDEPSSSSSSSSSVSFSDSSSPSFSVSEELPAAAKAPPVTRAVWEAYSEAYWERWGNQPSDNRTIRSQMKAFIERVGAGDAPVIARSYLKRNDSLYVNARHDFGLCLRDCQKIRTDWLSGVQITSIEARQIEGKQAHMNVFDQVMAMQKAKEAGNG